MDHKTKYRAGACLLVAAVCMLWAASAFAEFGPEATPLWEYDVPEDFNVSEAMIEQTPEGGTIMANSVGMGAEATCTVVVVSREDGDGGQDGSSWKAQAYPYKHSEEGTACLGVEPHPDGGFFVRGQRSGAQEGDVSGFTAEIGPDGNEKWLLHDTETAEAGDFRGHYLTPHGAIAYSAEFDYLVTTTIGEFSVGMADEKKVTHVSVLRDGNFRIPAKTIGDGGGFGVIGGLTTRSSDGYFLLYLYSFGSQGANFYAYNGRESVDRFSPLGEEWSGRFVKAVRGGPDERVHLLWLKRESNNPDSRVAVVDDADGSEAWTGAYSASAEMGGSEVLLGLPADLHVGSEYVVIRYSDPSTEYARVLSADDGTELGVVDLGELTDYSPVTILGGPEGGLKLLAEGDGRLYEYALRFEGDGGGGGGDAGLPDGGADVGTDDGGDDSGGCHVSGGAAPGPTGAVLWAVLVVAFRSSRPRREQDADVC